MNVNRLLKRLVFGQNKIDGNFRQLFLRLGVVGTFFMFFLILLLYVAGIFRPAMIYYILHEYVFYEGPYVVMNSPDSGELFVREEVDEKIIAKYEKLLYGTWAIENPYTALFELRNWSGWQETRLYFYPNGEFKLIRPIKHIEYLDEHKIVGDVSGTWKLSASVYYGVSFSEHLRHMVLWEIRLKNRPRQYKLHQPIELPGETAGGLIWKKISDQTDDIPK
ncbi:MAG: hypothetical protein LBT09_05520 [Planctomycetaceae bacterium]|jgi:hypothetical protein|nr:hypothetical protein [Planctomycetaceae bacterium]